MGKLCIKTGYKPETYFCDTLEPAWRNLLGVKLSKEEEDLHLGRKSNTKAMMDARGRDEPIWITVE